MANEIIQAIQETEEIDISETTSDEFKELEDRLMKKTMRELDRIEALAFTPDKDVEVLDTMLSWYTSAMKKVAAVDIADIDLEMLEEISKLMDGCRSAIVTLLKEKRMLANQPYGQQAQFGNQVSRIMQVRRNRQAVRLKPSENRSLPEILNETNNISTVCQGAPVALTAPRINSVVDIAEYLPKTDFTPYKSSDKEVPKKGVSSLSKLLTDNL